MTDQSHLRPATRGETVETLAFALQYDGKKRRALAPEFTSRIAAERLLEHLERCGFVLMKNPTAPVHSSSSFQRPPPSSEG